LIFVAPFATAEMPHFFQIRKVCHEELVHECGERHVDGTHFDGVRLEVIKKSCVAFSV